MKPYHYQTIIALLVVIIGMGWWSHEAKQDLLTRSLMNQLIMFQIFVEQNERHQAPLQRYPKPLEPRKKWTIGEGS